MYNIKELTTKEMECVIYDSMSLVSDQELLDNSEIPINNTLFSLYNEKRDQLQQYRLNHNNYNINMNKIDLLSSFSSLEYKDKKEARRMEKVLEDNGIFCVLDMCLLTEDEFSNLPGISILATCHISDILKLGGLSFGMTMDELKEYHADCQDEIQPRIDKYFHLTSKKINYALSKKVQEIDDKIEQIKDIQREQDEKYARICKMTQDFYVNGSQWYENQRNNLIKVGSEVRDELKGFVQLHSTRLSNMIEEYENGICRQEEKQRVQMSRTLETHETHLKNIIESELKKNNFTINSEKLRFRNYLIQAFVDSDNSIFRTKEDKIAKAVEKADNILQQFIID